MSGEITVICNHHQKLFLIGFIIISGVILFQRYVVTWKGMAMSMFDLGTSITSRDTNRVWTINIATGLISIFIDRMIFPLGYRWKILVALEAKRENGCIKL